jgi:hypothetical protein
MVRLSWLIAFDQHRLTTSPNRDLRHDRGPRHVDRVPDAAGDGLAAVYRPGTVVRNQLFGMGVVSAFMPSGRVHSVIVDFKAVGRKTLVLEYAKLQRVEF